MKYLLTLLLMISCFSVFAQESKYGQKAKIEIKEPKGPKPYSSLDLNNNPNQFQFAVVTDRTGGPRPGVFMEGVKRLNLLQPEFVMSVGDLIDGYTENLDDLNRQWDEFDSFIDQLEMPFFYLPGNHDITNKVMEDLWKKRLGPTYYHFKYKDVLFLCLNSEDQYRGSSRGTISDEQYEWIKKTLAENTDVKWTMVFMHQPLWLQNAETLRWPDVETLLSNREHTVFVGHRHHYTKYERNNGKYIMLATTGGSSGLRGPEFGEFDHVVWITMTDQGPIIANLQLEGVYDENVVDEEEWNFIAEMQRRNPIAIEPLYVDKDFESGEMSIKITNDADIPMHVKLKTGFSFHYRSDLEQNKLVVEPNSVAIVKMMVEKRKKRSSAFGEAVDFSAGMSYEGDNLPKIEFPVAFKVAPEQKYLLEKSTQKINVDGDISEWDEMPYQLQAQDNSTASGAFAVKYDDDFIYFAGKVEDDFIYNDNASVAFEQDFFAIVLNSDPLTISALDNGAGWYRNSFYALISPSSKDMPSSTWPEGDLPEGAQMVSKVVKGGYLFEAAIPTTQLKERQGDDWKTARINVFVRDRDQNNSDSQVLFWQPNWRGNDNRLGSGMFFRK
ncbi:MAG: metallophosphoesterase [Bacteroidota bacterium]